MRSSGERGGGIPPPHQGSRELVRVRTCVCVCPFGLRSTKKGKEDGRRKEERRLPRFGPFRGDQSRVSPPGAQLRRPAPPRSRRASKPHGRGPREPGRGPAGAKDGAEIDLSRRRNDAPSFRLGNRVGARTSAPPPGPRPASPGPGGPGSRSGGRGARPPRVSSDSRFVAGASPKRV